MSVQHERQNQKLFNVRYIVYACHVTSAFDNGNFLLQVLKLPSNQKTSHTKNGTRTVWHQLKVVCKL